MESLPWTVVWQVPCPTVALGPHRFDVRHRALVMGILNRTPDSFFDQGQLLRLRRLPRQGRAARRRGRRLPRRRRGQGRPRPRGRRRGGARARRSRRSRRSRPASTCRCRSTPGGRRCSGRRSRAGAVVGNDISGFADPEYLPVAAAAGASVVATHIRIGPRVPDPEPVYDEPVVDAVCRLPPSSGRGGRGGRDPARAGDGRRRPRPREDRAAVARAAAGPRPPGRPRLAAVPLGVQQAVPRRPGRHRRWTIGARRATPPTPSASRSAAASSAPTTCGAPGGPPT